MPKLVGVGRSCSPDADCLLAFFSWILSPYNMADINCTGCGGMHPRPGGSRCKNLKFGVRKEEITGNTESDSSSEEDVGASNPDSRVAWELLLTKEEITAMPSRSEDGYLPFCENVISDLQGKLSKMSEQKRVSDAEDKISRLMSKLKLGQKPSRRKSCPPLGGHQSPSMPAHSPTSAVRFGSSGLHDPGSSSPSKSHSYSMGFPRSPAETVKNTWVN